MWAGIKHDLGLKGDAPLLACHFSAAENNLNQRVTVAQQITISARFWRSERVAESGEQPSGSERLYSPALWATTLHALTQEQLQNMLQLLQNGQLSIPQPQQRQPTLRPLLPAEHNTLNQQVSRLAAATGEPGKLIWQSMLELCGVKNR